MVHPGLKKYSAIIEKSAFCGTEIHIALSTGSKAIHFRAVITDFSDDTITIGTARYFQQTKRASISNNPDNTLTLRIPDTNSVFEYICSVTGMTFTESGQTLFSVTSPSECRRINHRRNPRISLASRLQEYQAEIKGRFGRESSFCCDAILDISGSTAALRLQRTDRRKLSTGSARTFIVRRAGKKVFQASVNREVINPVPTGDREDQRHILFFEPVGQRGMGKRRIRRVAPPRDIPVFIEVIHPLLPDVTLKGTLENFSKIGMSFSVGNSAVPVFRGMLLNKIRISIPFRQPFYCSARVVHCTSEPERGESLRHIGVELRRVSEKMNLSSIILYLQDLDTTLVDAGSEDFDDMLNHLFSSHFIYRQKRLLLQDHAGTVLNTQHRLLGKNSVSKTIISKHHGHISGFIQLLKYHNNAWLVQHLAGGGTGGMRETGKMVVLGGIEFFLNPEVNEPLGIEYVLCYFRPQNPYPVILFDGFSRQINDPSISGSFNYTYCNVDTNRMPQSPLSRRGLSCSEASGTELDILESFIDSHYGTVFKRVEGLEKNHFTHSRRLTDEYQQCGLLRKRIVICLRRKNSAPDAFSVCELSSPGMNLSELTNAFKIYRLNSENTQWKRAVPFLMHVTLEMYRKNGITAPVLLTPPGSPVPDPFAQKKDYTFWYIDASHFREFQLYFREVSTDLKKHLKRFRSSGRMPETSSAP